jgi:hypothetical protein
MNALPEATQDRLRQMMQDIAELADLLPPSTSRAFGELGPHLLQLRLGKYDVRYSISENDRTLTIEHVIVPDDEELPRTG